MIAGASSLPEKFNSDFLVTAIEVALGLLDLSRVTHSTSDAHRYRAAAWNVHNTVLYLLLQPKLGLTENERVKHKFSSLQSRLNSRWVH